MTLNQPPPDHNEISTAPAPNGHAGHDRSRARSADDYWTKCPQLYAKCRAVGAEIVRLRRAEIKETGDKGYPCDVGSIRITKSGEVTCSGVITLTDKEKEDMAAEVAAANFPKSEPAPRGSLPPPLKDSDPREHYDYVFRNAAGEALFVERRFEPKTEGGKKTCLPWSYRDGQWLPEAPDELPLFGLDHLKNAATIFIHEGPKAARKWQELRVVYVDGRPMPLSAENRAALKAHPWGEVLKHGAHVGWAGGAYRAHDTDWSTLPRDARIVIIADNDTPGVEAASAISRILSKNGHKGRVTVVRFNNRFKDGFDLADPWPTHADWWSKKTGEYLGPTLMDCELPATYATETTLNNKAKAVLRLRSEFAAEWMYAVTPDLFIHRHRTDLRFSESPFNALVRPFSDVPNTAKMLKTKLGSQVLDIAYRPGKDLGVITVDGKHKINIFLPSRRMPKRGDPKPWLNYLKQLVPDKDERELLKRWVATLIACPEVRMEYGVLLISEETGVGKTSLGSICGELVGKHNTRWPSESALTTSEFNGHLAHTRLIVVNELYAGHDNKAADRLKTYMTDKEVEVNEKYEKAYTIEAWAHFLACSNSKRALKIVAQDRRWLVPRVTEEKKSSEYWRAFHDWLDDGGLAIIAQWAKDYVARHGHVRKSEHAPMTAAKQAMIEDGRSPGARMAYEFAELVKGKAEPIAFGLEPLHAAIAAERRLTINDHKMEGKELIAQTLRQAGLVEVKRARIKQADGTRPNVRIFVNDAIRSGATWAEMEPNYKKPEDMEEAWPI